MSTTRVGKPGVLAVVDYFTPTRKAGGSLRTCINLVESLGERFSFRVVTRDRDGRAGPRYPATSRTDWASVGKAAVRYLSPAHYRRIPAILRKERPMVLYLNSFFSLGFSVMPLILRALRLGSLGRVPCVLAPRGELARGALGVKRLRKRVYLSLFRALGLYRGVIWLASSEPERRDIPRWLGADARVVMAPIIKRAPAASAVTRDAKAAGRLRVVFLSRIVSNKNLIGALEILSGVKGTVRFDIYGPVVDERYWNACQLALARLPANIDAAYHGAVGEEEVPDIMAGSELLLLPTHGESFGQVIVEALSNGCPVLISDRTPWRGLQERRVGWDIPLVNVAGFVEVVERCVGMDQEEFGNISNCAVEFGLPFLDSRQAVKENLEIFETVARASAVPTSPVRLGARV